MLNLSQFYRVSFCWHEGVDQRANGRWLTDQSKRVSLLLCYNLKFEIVVNRIPTPALVLEMVLKKNVLSHSLWCKGLFVDR